MLNLSKGSGLPSSTNDYQLANDFGKFFAQKIAEIRFSSTNQVCLPLNATSTVTASCFSEFNLLSESEVFDLIIASSKKSCPLDPFPTKLLNECVDVLLPLITKIINPVKAKGFRLILVIFRAPGEPACSSAAAAEKGWITPCL